MVNGQRLSFKRLGAVPAINALSKISYSPFFFLIFEIVTE